MSQPAFGFSFRRSQRKYEKYETSDILSFVYRLCVGQTPIFLRHSAWKYNTLLQTFASDLISDVLGEND